MTRIAFSLAAFLLAAPGFAQETAPQDAEQPAADRVVVTGQTLDEDTLAEVTREFVAEVADPATHSVGIARWQDDICVGVENLALEPAQFIADRVSEIALELGLDPGEPGCTPNIAILFAPDGNALAELMLETQPRAFRPWGGTGGTTQGLHALEQFRTSGAAVRWWQVTLPVDQRGWAAIELNELDGPPWVPGGNSHITVLHRDVVLSAIVVVEGPQIAASGISWEQLADYIAFVALAQIDPDADSRGFDTILNLFVQDPATVSNGLSAWDISYLRALYEFNQYRIPRSQRGVLANELVRQITGRGGE